MHKFEIYLSFFVILISTTVLFQNCSDTSSNTPTVAEEDNNPSGGTPPENLINQAIELDNKGFAGGSTWSVGGDDFLYYETNYRASFQSTMVTIYGQNGVPILKVEADNCDEEKKNLSIDEADSVSSFFRDNIENTLFNGADPSVTLVEGCSFPRLVLDSRSIYQPTGEPSVDFEFYFASRECTPEGELYVAEVNGYDPEQAKQQAEAFFNSQIDDACGFE